MNFRSVEIEKHKMFFFAEIENLKSKMKKNLFQKIKVLLNRLKGCFMVGF